MKTPLRAFSTTVVLSLAAMIGSHSLLQMPVAAQQPHVALPDESKLVVPRHKKVRGSSSDTSFAAI